MSQKQISEIIGIGTSFISQIETGKDPMPRNIPDKLIAAFGKEEVEKYFREPLPEVASERMLRKAYYKPGRTGVGYGAKKTDPPGSYTDTVNPEILMAATKTDSEWINRVLTALERRDALAMMQQKEYERQGERIDELLEFLKS